MKSLIFNDMSVISVSRLYDKNTTLLDRYDCWMFACCWCSAPLPESQFNVSGRFLWVFCFIKTHLILLYRSSVCLRCHVCSLFVLCVFIEPGRNSQSVSRLCKKKKNPMTSDFPDFAIPLGARRDYFLKGTSQRKRTLVCIYPCLSHPLYLQAVLSFFFFFCKSSLWVFHRK